MSILILRTAAPGYMSGRPRNQVRIRPASRRRRARGPRPVDRLRTPRSSASSARSCRTERRPSRPKPLTACSPSCSATSRPSPASASPRWCTSRSPSSSRCGTSRMGRSPGARWRPGRSQASGWSIVPPMPARRARRARDGPAVGRRGRDDRCLGARRAGRSEPAADGPVRRGRQQHRPEGRPHPADPRRGRVGPAAWGGPRGLLLGRPEAADGPVGLARDTDRARRAGRARQAPGDLDADLGATLDGLLEPEEVDRTRARLDELLATERFPQPSPDWPAVPWPPY